MMVDHKELACPIRSAAALAGGESEQDTEGSDGHADPQQYRKQCAGLARPGRRCSVRV